MSFRKIVALFMAAVFILLIPSFSSCTVKRSETAPDTPETPDASDTPREYPEVYQTGSYVSAYTYLMPPDHSVVKRKGDVDPEAQAQKTVTFEGAEYEGQYFRSYDTSVFEQVAFYTGGSNGVVWTIEYERNSGAFAGITFSYSADVFSDDDAHFEEARQHAINVAAEYIDPDRYTRTEYDLLRSRSGVPQKMYVFSFRKQTGDYRTNDHLNVYILPDGQMVGVRMYDLGRYDGIAAPIVDEAKLKTSVEAVLSEKIDLTSTEYVVTDRYLAAEPDGKLLMISEIEWNSENLALSSVAVIATEI